MENKHFSGSLPLPKCFPDAIPVDMASALHEGARTLTAKPYAGYCIFLTFADLIGENILLLFPFLLTGRLNIFPKIYINH